MAEEEKKEKPEEEKGGEKEGKAEEEKKEKSKKIPTHLVCPQCDMVDGKLKEKYGLRAGKFCRKCGSTLKSVEVPHCSACNEFISLSDEYCTNCGKRLKETPKTGIAEW